MVVNIRGDQIYVGFLSMKIYMQYAWCLRLIFAVPGFWILEYQLVLTKMDPEKVHKCFIDFIPPKICTSYTVL